jgi:hypothetical protein
MNKNNGADRNLVIPDSALTATPSDPDGTLSGTSNDPLPPDPNQDTNSSKATSTEPLTISLNRGLIRKVRVIAACEGTTVSKIVTALLAEAVTRQLPVVLADLQSAASAKDGLR